MSVYLKRICLLLPFLALLFLSLYHLDFILDDPFISFRYARNLLDGHGLVFNPGERVEGYSNFLWIILLAPFMKLGLDPVPVSKVLGLLFGMMTIYSTLQLSRFVLIDKPHLTHAAAYSAAILGFSWYFSLWSVGALETTLFSYLVVVATHLLLRNEYRSGGLDMSFLPLALAGMTRPEAPLFFVLFLVVKLCFVLRGRRSLSSLLTWVAAFTLCYGSYFTWRALYYGQLLPNTYYAKTLGGRQQYIEGAVYPLDFLKSQGPLFLLMAALAVIGLLRQLRRNTVIRILSLLLCGYASFIIYSGGDWMCGYRFVVHVYPIYAVLLASSLIELIDFATLTAGLRRHANPFTLGIFSLVIASSMLASLRDLRLSVPWLGNWYTKLSLSPAGPYYDLALFLRQNVPAGSWLALGEAGIIPYYANQVNVIDFLGIVDRHVARIPGQLHRKGDAEYVLDRNPDYILLLIQEDAAGRLRYVSEPVRQFLESRRFGEKYRLAFKLPRANDGNLRDEFCLYRRYDLPDPTESSEPLTFTENPNVRLEVSPSELVAGESTLALRVTNLDASAIDICYTLNGKRMPIIHSWALDANHSARMFVDRLTPKGRYVYLAIKDSRDPASTGWIRVDVPIVVR